jgi:hypothetical protein
LGEDRPELSGVDAGERVQRVIQSDQVDRPVVVHDGSLVQRTC